jgi:hypothetical protein
LRLIKRHRPSPALVISLISLFVAMGGTAWALANNSVRSRHIVNDAVTSADIKGGGGKTGDIKNRDVNALLAVAKGFATIQAGVNPSVLNFGGQQTATPNGVSVSRIAAGRYDVTFAANTGTGKFVNVDSVNDLAVTATGAGLDAGLQPVVSWVPTASSANSSQIKLRINIRRGDNNVLFDRNFTVLFYARTTS